MRRISVYAALWCGVCAAAAHGAAARHVTAVKTKAAIVAADAEIPQGVILIEEGVITAVDAPGRLQIPWNAEVIDASDKIVMPGLVVAHTSEGLERQNESMPDVPWISTFDAIDPFQPYFRRALRDGVAAALVLPGNATRFGGTGTIVKPAGATVDEMLIQRRVGLKVSLAPAGGLNRMGHMQKLREFLRAEQKFLADFQTAKKEAAQAGRPVQEEVPLEHKDMEDLLAGRLTAFVYCQSAGDAVRALELVDEFKLKAVLVLGTDAWRAAGAIAKAKLPVILPPDAVFFDEDPETGEVVRRNLPAIFAQARVPFALQCHSRSINAGSLWQVAAEAVRHGLGRKEALAAITATPAQLLGLGQKLGQIKPGFRANLLFLTGNPLDPRTWVDRVMIDGAFVYERAQDKYLQELIEGTKQ